MVFLQELYGYYNGVMSLNLKASNVTRRDLTGTYYIIYDYISNLFGKTYSNFRKTTACEVKTSAFVLYTAQKGAA